MEQSMKFSASMLSTWMSCPLQAHFDSVVDMPRVQNAKASFGTCMHDALYIYNTTGNYDAAVARFCETWENPALLDVVPDYWPRNTTYGGLMQRGLEMLEKYREMDKWDSRVILVAEHKFCVPFGEYLLSGVVDVMDTKRSSRGKKILRITDYKTNTVQPTKIELLANVQFTIYDYASRQPEFWLGFDDGTGKYPPIANGEELFDYYDRFDRRSVWYHLWTNKEIDAGSRDDTDFMRLYRVCQQVERAQKLDVYVPNISGTSCTFCRYTEICQVVIPIKDKIENPDLYLENEGAL